MLLNLASEFRRWWGLEAGGEGRQLTASKMLSYGGSHQHSQELKVLKGHILPKARRKRKGLCRDRHPWVTSTNICYTIYLQLYSTIHLKASSIPEVLWVW